MKKMKKMKFHVLLILIISEISEIQKSAEEELGNSEISDQEKYLLDQKIEVLKSIN